MSLCTHGVQTGEGYECSSCVTSPTFAEQIDTHLQRLAAERPAPVTPAEERTGVSDVQAKVLEEVEALRREFREYAAKRFVAGGEVYDSPLRKVLDDESRVLRNSWLTRLDRIASAVRRGEQR